MTKVTKMEITITVIQCMVAHKLRKSCLMHDRSKIRDKTFSTNIQKRQLKNWEFAAQGEEQANTV